MRLDATTFSAPSRVLTNEDVVALVREHSRPSLGAQLDHTLRKIDLLLKRSGARCRRWLADGERPLDLTVRSVRQALDRAGWGADDVDLLMYASIDRGFLEPANAYFVAASLGMRSVECFDVLDACNGWLRSAQIAQNAFAAGEHRRALIVNAEFPMLPGGAVYPALFRLESEAEVEWSFAAFTLGEGVTATLLSADTSNPWTFRFSSRPALSDLCTVPLYGYARYAEPSPRLARKGEARFSADSTTMFAAAAVELPALFRSLDLALDSVQLIVPHAATRRALDDGADLLGVRHLLHHVYPEYGNLASASIPAGIATALDAGRLGRDDRLIAVSASAGMSFGLAAFQY
jgi:3-oxoacyl-[acyl-carrier-protein] synthase III